jgi:Flp pilus assembly protein TadB
VARRTPREARVLGLWTAAWLFVLLLVGVVWLGDLWLQWPVLLVPLAWALVAVLRGRRDRRPDPSESRRRAPPEDRWDERDA